MTTLDGAHPAPHAPATGAFGTGFGPPLLRWPWWLVTMLVVAGACILPFDAAITTAWSGLDLPGDVDQELRSLQQFGQFGSLVLVAIVVCLLDRPAFRRTLLDLGLAMLIGILIANLLKSGIGRVRPAFGEADAFLGPWWTRGDGELAWSQRASMPSSHTMAAAILATWMWTVVPRVRWLGVVLCTIVGAARVRFGAHWPSDVLFGAALGVLSGTVVIGRLWGTRLLDAFWKRFVDRDASPAWPEVAAAVRGRHAGHAD